MLRTFRQLLALFDRDERRRFHALLVLMVFVGMAELVGISTILVLLRVLTDPEAIIDDGPGAWLYATLGFSGIGAFQIAMAVGVVAVFCVALMVRAAGTFAMTRFAQMRSFSLSTRLLQSYLSRPYAWFLGQNSAELRKTALDEVNQLVMRSLTPFLRMLASVIVVVLILGFLLAFEPVVSLAAFAVLGGAYGVIYRGAARGSVPSEPGTDGAEQPALPPGRRGHGRFQGGQAEGRRGRFHRPVPRAGPALGRIADARPAGPADAPVRDRGR